MFELVWCELRLSACLSMSACTHTHTHIEVMAQVQAQVKQGRVFCFVFCALERSAIDVTFWQQNTLSIFVKARPF